MSKLLHYENKSSTYFNLYNPAFCSQLLRIAIDEYENKSKKKMPISMTFLLLPILLNRDLRHSVDPNSNFHAWAMENFHRLTSFNKNTERLIDITKSALILLLQAKFIQINENAEIEITGTRPAKTFSSSDLELREYYKQSRYLGRLLGPMDDLVTVFSILGIRP